MPKSFLGRVFSKLPQWRPILTLGRALNIEPEIYHQDRQFTFGRAGIVKLVRMKGGRVQAGEISGDNQFNIDKPGAGTIDPAKALENNRGYVYASVNAIAREVQTIEWRLFKRDGEENDEQPDHELLDLLDSVNESMTGPELKYLLSAHLDLVGNAYWYLEGVTDEMSKPTAIYPMDPSKVKVLYDRNVWPYKISGYKMRLDNRDHVFKPYQILHFRLPNPSNMYEGVGPVEAGAEYIDNDNYAMEFNRKFFLNGARPAGFLESEMVSETQVEALKIGFMDAHGGIDNMNRIGILPKGVKWSPTGASPKDMDFKNLSDTMRDRILAVLGVSKTILGTAESDTNRSTAETADYVFSKRVIKPRMQLICSFLNEKLVARYGDDLYISFIDPVPEDRAARTTEMQTAVGSQPVMTVNEAREEYMGLGPVDGGDALMRPVAMQDVNARPADPNEPPVPPSKAKAQRAANGERVAFRPLRTKLQTRAKERQKIADSLTAKMKVALEERAAHPTKRFESTKDQDEAAWKRFDADVSKAETQLAEVIRKINTDQKKEVLENLPAAVEKAVDPGDLFDIQKWIAITVDAVTPIIETLYKTQAEEAAAAIDEPDLDPFPEAAKTALRNSIQLMSQSYNQTTLDTLEAKLNEGLEQGLPLSDLSKTVSEIYDEWSDKYRADRVAKTEAFRTANSALKETWKASGVVKTIRWYTAGDPCAFCAEMDGKTIDVEQSFFDKGDSLTAGSGDDAQTMNLDYADVEAPPLHCNCKCFVRPDEISI